jgi:transposase InsO family protein
MAQLLHGSATTTARTRADIQASAEPAAALARRYGVNRKTVLKWRRRGGVADAPMGPRERRSTVLSEVEEAAVVAFRVQTRLPLDDVYAALRPSIPGLTRSSAHRALQRQGVSRLPRAARPRHGRFASYEIGYFHVDFAELRTAREKAYLFVAVDRTSKVAFARVYRRATSLVAAAFLKVLARAVPYRIHTVLTDNGIQFGDAGGRRVYDRGHHPFGRVCRALGVEHRFTKPYHPWTNGQAERMVRTLKEATVRAFHYDGIAELRRHVADYLTAYNYAKHLKALRWRTPVETLEALWQSRAELFRRSPAHLTLGPNT